jgi:hypothetical protein
MITYEEQVRNEMSARYQQYFSFYDLVEVNESTETVLKWSREYNVLTVIVIRIPSLEEMFISEYKK